MTDARRGPRCRFEHHAPARCAGRARRSSSSTRTRCGSRSARRSSASAPSPTCTSPRRRRRFASLRSARGCTRSSRSTSSSPRRAGRARTPHELVAALTRAAGVPVRVLSTDEEGRLAYGGAVATAPHRAARPHRRLRRRRRLDRDRDRLALGTSRLAGVGRPRLGPAHHARRLARRGAGRGGGGASNTRAAAGRRCARGGRQRAGGAQARRLAPRRGRACRGAAPRRDESDRGRSCAVRRRSVARAHPPAAASCCSPRCSGCSACRCTCATAGSARAQSSSTPPRARRSELRRAQLLEHRHAVGVDVDHDGRALAAGRDPTTRLDDVAVRAGDASVELGQQLERGLRRRALRRGGRRARSSSPSSRRAARPSRRSGRYGLETTRPTPRCGRARAARAPAAAALVERAELVVAAPLSRSPADAWRSRTTLMRPPRAAARSRS